MSLKPYWVKHPWQLRLAAGLALLLLPLVLVYWAVETVWEARDEVVGFWKEMVGYLVKGGDY